MFHIAHVKYIRNTFYDFEDKYEDGHKTEMISALCFRFPKKQEIDYLSAERDGYVTCSKPNFMNI